MLSKINFTYKKVNQDHKKEKILKQLRTRERVNLNDTKSLNNSLDLTNKVDNHKILNVREIVSQTKDTNIVNINNNNIELKINDKIHINSLNLNETNYSELETMGAIDKMDFTFVNDFNNKELTTLKLYNSNNKFIDTLVSTYKNDFHNGDTIDKTSDNNFNKESTNIKLYNNKNSRNKNSKFMDTLASLNERGIAEDLFVDNYILPYNVERIRNKGIKIINNVYQSKYNYGRSNCTGLGDFIRGCYFILEFCEEHRFEAKIVFNNHIAKFLKIKTHNLALITNVLSSIQFFKNNNFSKYNIQNGFILDPERDNKNIMSDFVNYVIDSPSYYGNVFTFCNSFPRNTIPEKNKEYMRKFLEPIDEIKMLIKQSLDELQLTLKGYTVIHIRSGDAFLKNENNNGFNSAYIYKLIQNIIFDVRYITENNPGIMNNYLLIADNNNIKNLLKEKFPAFKLIIKPITHFGDGVVLEEERVKNTLIDFYLMSFANYIMSYSAYEHGSGFSYWCAKTFDVPYTCKYIV
jgi:hypothetical protein